MPPQGLPVVLNPYGSRLRGAQGVDAEQVGQRAMVDGDGLGDLEEPDEFQSVETLRAGLVAMNLGEPGVDGRVGADQTVEVSEPKEPPNRVHHRDHRGIHQPAFTRVTDVELDVATLDPDQRIESVPLAPLKPAAQLEGV